MAKRTLTEDFTETTKKVHDEQLAMFKRTLKSIDEQAEVDAWTDALLAGQIAEFAWWLSAHRAEFREATKAALAAKESGGTPEPIRFIQFRSIGIGFRWRDPARDPPDPTRTSPAKVRVASDAYWAGVVMERLAEESRRRAGVDP